MTTREEFASRAMQGLAAGQVGERCCHNFPVRHLTDLAVQMADELITSLSIRDCMQSRQVALDAEATIDLGNPPACTPSDARD